MEKINIWKKVRIPKKVLLDDFHGIEIESTDINDENGDEKSMEIENSTLIPSKNVNPRVEKKRKN